jgi:glycosyltransferase involved in cell wall biosynthesis
VTSSPRAGSRPRVLLLAASCGPERGSEPGVGWNRAVQAARSFDTWVVCTDTFASEIRRHLASAGDRPGLHVVFVPKSRGSRWLAALPGGYYLGYHLWHRRAYRVARALHAQVGFDLAHQVTLCTYREPGYLGRLGIPWIWGPVGGTQNCPWRFLAECGLGGGAREAVRTVANVLQLRLDRRGRRAGRRAAALLAANSTNRRDLERAWGVRPQLLLETGVARLRPLRRARADDAILRVLWCGVMQPFKGLSLLLRALTLVPPDVPYVLRVIGDGPARARWVREARRLGVAPRIVWLGQRPHAEVVARYAESDVFVFTSLRDTSGNVVLEALAAGVPVVCLDHQGAADIVTEACGIKVPVTTPRQVSAALAGGLTDLARDPARLERLRGAAVERARQYLWSHQGDVMASIYRRVAHRAAGATALDAASLGEVAAPTARAGSGS